MWQHVRADRSLRYTSKLLGLVGTVSIYCDWERKQVFISVWQHVRADPSLRYTSKLLGREADPSLRYTSKLLGREADPSLRYTSMLLGREADPSLRYTSMLLGRERANRHHQLCIQGTEGLFELRSSPGMLKLARVR